MKLACLSGGGLRDNFIFDDSVGAHRDNCAAPFALLKKTLLEHGISINTEDVIAGQETVFELHMDVSKKTNKADCYLLLLETPFIQRRNGNIEDIKKYKRVFTWDDTWVDNDKYIKINFPNPISVPVVDGLAAREFFCCLIAGNKKTTVPTPLDLYSERVNAIRWFEKNAPNDFNLYGRGWDVPSPFEGPKWKPLRKLWLSRFKRSARTAFPSYRGELEHKKEVLSNTRFSICYENVRDLPGYITEKIFDAFFAGCVPVYWGAKNVLDHIPGDCFVDRRDFNSTADVYRFLKNMTNEQFVTYQQNIIHFLRSEKVVQYSAEYFANTITHTVLKDLHGQ